MANALTYKGKIACDYHGRAYMRPKRDGYLQCSRCHVDADLLRGARKVIPSLPRTVKEFRAVFGEAGVEGLRRVMAQGAYGDAVVRQLPSQRTRSSHVVLGMKSHEGKLVGLAEFLENHGTKDGFLAKESEVYQ